MTQGSLSDYSGRTVDLAAYQGIAPAGDQQLRPTLADPGTSGTLVTGTQKVVQRVITELLKERGSEKFWPDEGNSFLTEMRAGYYETQLDVFAGFAQAVADITPLIQAQELAADPADERFVDLQAKSVTVIADQAIIVAQLITQAGPERTYIFPLSIPL